MTTMDSIISFSKRVAQEYKPERIVLFGSYATGNATPDSDVDLLIVMPFEGKSVQKSVEMRMKFRPQFPVDLLVRTPEAVKQRLDMGDGFLQDVMERGKVLYEAHHG